MKLCDNQYTEHGFDFSDVPSAESGPAVRVDKSLDDVIGEDKLLKTALVYRACDKVDEHVMLRTADTWIGSNMKDETEICDRCLPHADETNVTIDHDRSR